MILSNLVCWRERLIEMGAYFREGSYLKFDPRKALNRGKILISNEGHRRRRLILRGVYFRGSTYFKFGR